MGLYLGLDLGTTKIAAVIIDAATGEPLAVASAPEPKPLSAAPGRSEWDAGAMVARALATGREALAASGRTGEVRGIGVTGQQHGMALAGSTPEGGPRPLGPFIGWQDRRADEPDGAFPSTVARMHHLAGEAALARTGCRLASGFLGATLYWLAGRELLPQEATCAVTLPDYVVACLCAQPPVTDPTNAAGAGLLDVAARRWDAELIAALDLRVDLLAPIRSTGAIVGQLAPDAAVALGLPAGVPVMNALGDNQASFFGSIGVATGDLLVNIGTGGQISAIAEGFTRGELLETRPYLGDTHLLVGAGILGGRSYALLRDFIRQIGREVFGVERTDDLYPLLNALAAATPSGSDGLRCDPRFGGNRFDPDQRGSFTGLDARTFTPGHLARAVLEGMAETFRALYDTMLAAGLTPRTRLVGSGNGLQRNPLLADRLNETFALPLVSPRHAEEAARGAATLAAIAVGELSADEATARLAHV